MISASHFGVDTGANITITMLDVVETFGTTDDEETIFFESPVKFVDDRGFGLVVEID